MNSADFNVFQNVANNEDSVTELLTNFLHFKSFRDAFFNRFLPELVCREQITADDLSTQQSINNFRPDIVVSTDDLEVLFEVKVQDTTLMDTQKTDYYSYLQELTDKQTFLCFIIPSDYRELETIKNIGRQEGVRIIYWKDIIGLIERNELNLSSQ